MYAGEKVLAVRVVPLGHLERDLEDVVHLQALSRGAKEEYSQA